MLINTGKLKFSHFTSNDATYKLLMINYSFTITVLFIIMFNTSSYSQWVRQGNGISLSNVSFNAIDACDNNTAVICGGGELYKTLDAGNTWQKLSQNIPSGFFVDISVVDKLHFWLSENGKILSTTNGGNDWSVQFDDTTLTPFINYLKMFDLNNGIAMGDAKNPEMSSIIPGPAIFLKTTDGGNKWNSVNDSAFGGASGDVWRRLDFIDANSGYFFEMGVYPAKLYKTTDGCKTWTATNCPLGNVDVIKFYNNNIGLVAGQEMSRTLDGGNSWETFTIKDSLGWPVDIEFVPGDPSKVWYTNMYNLYYSQDTGRIWVKQDITNDYLNGWDLVFTDSVHGWFIGYYGKIFHTTNNGGNLTAISNSKNSLPANSFLAQNYPNPFNPSTVLSWQLAKNSFVTLKIYNTLGKEIITLVSEYQKAGKHTVTFNSNKLSSVKFTSGIYFYRIQAGDFTETKKLVLLK